MQSIPITTKIVSLIHTIHPIKFVFSDQVCQRVKAGRQFSPVFRPHLLINLLYSEDCVRHDVGCRNPKSNAILFRLRFLLEN
jgi:hypothetical protein